MRHPGLIVPARRQKIHTTFLPVHWFHRLPCHPEYRPPESAGTPLDL